MHSRDTGGKTAALLVEKVDGEKYRTHRGALGLRGVPPGSAPMHFLRTHAEQGARKGMADRQGRLRKGTNASLGAPVAANQ